MSLVGWIVISERDVPPGNAWLSAPEREVEHGLRFPARRRDWRLGRFAAKTALRRWPGSPVAAFAPGEFSILADDDGAPVVERAGLRQRCAISISHRAGRALAVVGEAGVGLGCDLELVEPRSDAFVRDYFVPAEQQWLEQALPNERALLTNLLWSGKESALKALHTGLRADTRSVVVDPERAGEGCGWQPLRVRADAAVLEGCWRVEADCVATVVTASAGHGLHAEPGHPDLAPRSAARSGTIPAPANPR
jgi:4'-phosphopantetheinyl transferase